MKVLTIQFRTVTLSAIMLFTIGCMPGPPPPLPPGILNTGIGWIVVWIFIALAAWGIVLIWKNIMPPDKTYKKDSIIDTLNDINNRLHAIEDKISQMEKEKKETENHSH